MEKFEIQLIENESDKATLVTPEEASITPLFTTEGIVELKDDEKEPKAAKAGDEKPEENKEEKQPAQEKEENKIPNLSVNIYDYFEDEELSAIQEELDKLEKPEEKEEFLKSKLDEKFTAVSEKILEETKDKVLTPLQKRFDSLTSAGVDEKISVDIIVGYKNLQEITKDSISEDPTVARKIYKNYLRLTTSFTDEKIEKEIKRFEDLGSLTDIATESYDELATVLKEKEANELKAAAKKKEEAEEKSKANAVALKTYLDNISEVAGIKVAPKMKENLIKFFTPVNNTDPLSELESHNSREFNTIIRLIAANCIKPNSKGGYTVDLSPLSADLQNKAVRKVVDGAKREQAKEMTKVSPSNQKEDSSENKNLDFLNEIETLLK